MLVELKPSDAPCVTLGQGGVVFLPIPRAALSTNEKRPRFLDGRLTPHYMLAQSMAAAAVRAAVPMSDGQTIVQERYADRG